LIAIASAAAASATEVIAASAIVKMLLDVKTHFWLQGTFEANASFSSALNAAAQALGKTSLPLPVLSLPLPPD
jgi:hypothetical protein